MKMSTRILRPAAAILALGALGIGVAACGGSSDTTTAAATSTTAATTAATTADTTTTASTSTDVVATTVNVTLGKPKEFSLVPSPGSVPAGKVTFTVKNDGAMVHELVVIKTNLDAGKLPTKTGEADETGNLGETGDMEAGTTKDVVLTLTPGHYALICNLPGHYVGGMYANFTVE